MYSIRVNSDLAALVHRTASYCGVEFGTIIRRAARDKLCNTLPVIQVENSELYHAGKNGAFSHNPESRPGERGSGQGVAGGDCHHLFLLPLDSETEKIHNFSC